MFMSPLGWYWVVVPLAVAALGVIVVLRGFGHMARGRGGKGATHLVVGSPLALIGLGAGLIALNTQTFARLSHESDVAKISIKSTNPAEDRYELTIQRLDAPNIAALTCRVQGDEWEMSARVQKWKPWANVLGLDTTYTLDQIDNKYFDAARANGKPITACDLKGPPPAVDTYVPQSWLFWLLDRSYTEHRRFGSAAYMPNADGAQYKVVMTQSGLNAEPVNEAAEKANAARP
ncbi:MAG TPA: hypothetical protein VG889_08615 [Rhizomicrobium sp.]|nr:hypothetical protein [Rhizomicrobium sp.]